MDIIDDKHIHQGHRQRMRAKLAEHGASIFDTYELLEMLLYYVIPYKDTNPIAKRLLASFGSLDGVLRASEDELVNVSGIGERAARFISRVGALSAIIGSEVVSEDDRSFDNYAGIGEFLTEYFDGDREPSVVILLLDNAMNLISVERLYRGIDYDNAAVRSDKFIAAIARSGASAAVTAHNHVYGPCYPTVGDRATDDLVERALVAAGVRYLEHFIVCGKRYIGISRSRISYISSTEPDESFNSPEEPTDVGERVFSAIARERATLLRELLSPLKGIDPLELSKQILIKYRPLENLFSTDIYSLEQSIGESAALMVKLYAYVCARRVTDGFVFGKPHTAVEIADYFKAAYIPASEETVYLMGFDAHGNPIGCECVGVGTVNSSEIIPRKILHTAVRMKASHAIIAHNHPHGFAEPSDEDMHFTSSISNMMMLAGVRLMYHLVVGGFCTRIIECTDF